MKKIPVFLLLIAFLASCTSATPIPTATSTPVIHPTATITNTPRPDGLWISPGVPTTLRTLAESWNIPRVNDPAAATQILDVSDSGSAWIYALVAPFPTVTDDVLFADLLSTWQGVPAGPLAGHTLMMDESTLAAFTVIWGEPASGS